MTIRILTNNAGDQFLGLFEALEFDAAYNDNSFDALLVFAIVQNNKFDTQGNIFLPEIGPVHLEGVTSEQLTDTVRRAIARTYRGNFGVYTNLLTASPVAVFVTGSRPTRPSRWSSSSGPIKNTVPERNPEYMPG